MSLAYVSYGEDEGSVLGQNGEAPVYASVVHR
jgi:hypothetical protein